MTLVEVEAIAHEVLVGNDEADVANREIDDEPTVGTIEKSCDRERRRPAQREQLPQVVQGKSRVDDILDHEHVTALDRRVQILEQTDSLVPAGCGTAVACELDEVQLVDRRNRAREIGGEEERSLGGPPEHETAVAVVSRDLGSELGDARLDLLLGEIGLADAKLGG